MSSSLPPHHHLRILLLAFFPPPRSPTARLLVLRRRRSVLQVGAAPLLHAAHGAARRWQGCRQDRASRAPAALRYRALPRILFMNQILIFCLDNHMKYIGLLVPYAVARGPCQRVNKTGSIGTAIYGVKVSSALLAHSIACEGHLRRHASTTTAAVATSATPTAATTHGRAPSGPLGGSGCDSCPDFHWKDLICGAKVRGTHGTSDSGMRAPERAALRLGTYGYHEAVRAPRTARPRHGVHVNTGLHRGKPRAEFDDAGMGRSRRLEVGHIARADGAKALPRGSPQVAWWGHFQRTKIR